MVLKIAFSSLFSFDLGLKTFFYSFLFPKCVLNLKYRIFFCFCLKKSLFLPIFSHSFQTIILSTSFYTFQTKHPPSTFFNMADQPVEKPAGEPRWPAGLTAVVDSLVNRAEIAVSIEPAESVSTVEPAESVTTTILSSAISSIPVGEENRRRLAATVRYRPADQTRWEATQAFNVSGEMLMESEVTGVFMIYFRDFL